MAGIGTSGETDLANFDVYTLAKVEQELQDTIYQENTYIRKMDERGYVVRGESGQYIVPKFLMGKNENSGWRTLSSPIPREAGDLARYGKELFGELSAGFPVDYVTKQKNSGEEKLIDYYETEKKAMIETVNEDVNKGLLEGSGSWPTPYGLDSLISQTPTAGTIHGIARSGNTWIQNKEQDSTCSTTVGFGSEVILDASKLRKEASRGMVDASNIFSLAVMDRTVYSQCMYYLPNVASVAPLMVQDAEKKQRFANDNGFNIAGAEAIWDHNASTDSIRFIGKDTVKIHILNNCDFKILPEQQSFNSFSSLVKMGVVLAHVNHNPSRCAVLYNFAS